MAYYIDDNECVKCGTCPPRCPYEAILNIGEKFKIDLEKCTNCGECFGICPVNAIKTEENMEEFL